MMTSESLVQYEGADRADFYVKFCPKVPHQVIDRIVSFLKLKYDGELNLALDVGCGSGQCTELLAQHFVKVIGTDVSAAQIDAAKSTFRLPNVQFWVSPAEQCPAIENESVQLVSASMAAHWFDLPAFFKEVHRVLCPKGVLAISGYDPVNYFDDYGPPKSEALRSALTGCLEKVGPFWTKSALDDLRNEYSSIILPYEETIREEIWVDEPRSLSSLVGYVHAWCGFQNLCKVKGHDAGQELLEELEHSVGKILNTDDKPPEEIQIKTKRKYFLLMGRKN